MSEMEPRVRSIVAVHLDVDPVRLKPEARLGEDLCVDSLAAIELAMVLEDEFDIALPEEVLGCVRTYGDVVSLVDARVAGRSSSNCS
jgi:acyl carrier protein